MFRLDDIQSALREFGIEAWLLFDFRGSNTLARRVLDLDAKPVTSRRFFYLIPARGEPTRLVHRIEPGALDHLPGGKRIYLSWMELEGHLREMLSGLGKVAMEYAPGLGNPYVSRVDAGTVEAVRACGVEVVSSGDLVQLFEATWDDEQWEMHQRATAINLEGFDRAWALIAERARADAPATECEIQRLILDHFRANGLTTYSPPIVGVGPHSGDPHFETAPETDTPIREGDFVLIDSWAKIDHPRGVYSDLTRVGFVGREVPARHAEVFAAVAAGRDAAIALVRERFARGEPLMGCEVDDAARNAIRAAGFADAFIHRTGHNIGRETHGNGANMDNLETRETRLVLPRVCFSIEPGIYLPEFGVRSEVNVFIGPDGSVHVTGAPLQTEIPALLA